ncbi:osmotically inducible protein OsmC [bacterium]|nr:osmotically inducible protein OsmC [bacterium]
MNHIPHKHSTVLDSHGSIQFDARLGDHSIRLDADPEFGGMGTGPGPKSLLLVALGGCTGMDVVSLLNKMRMPFDTLQIEVEGTLTDEHPKVYAQIALTYRIHSAEPDAEKIEKAVSLSLERYCGVYAMLRQVARIEHQILINP